MFVIHAFFCDDTVTNFDAFLHAKTDDANLRRRYDEKTSEEKESSGKAKLPLLTAILCPMFGDVCVFVVKGGMCVFFRAKRGDFMGLGRGQTDRQPSFYVSPNDGQMVGLAFD